MRSRKGCITQLVNEDKTSFFKNIFIKRFLFQYIQTLVIEMNKVANDIHPNFLKEGFNFLAEIGCEARHQSIFRRLLFKCSSPNFASIQILLKSPGGVEVNEFR